MRKCTLNNNISCDSWLTFSTRLKTDFSKICVMFTSLSCVLLLEILKVRQQYFYFICLCFRLQNNLSFCLFLLIKCFVLIDHNILCVKVIQLSFWMFIATKNFTPYTFLLLCTFSDSPFVASFLIMLFYRCLSIYIFSWRHVLKYWTHVENLYLETNVKFLYV